MGIGVGDAGQQGTCTPKFGKQYFSDKYHIKFGHFVNFHTDIFG